MLQQIEIHEYIDIYLVISFTKKLLSLSRLTFYFNQFCRRWLPSQRDPCKWSICFGYSFRVTWTRKENLYNFYIFVAGQKTLSKMDWRLARDLFKGIICVGVTNMQGKFQQLTNGWTKYGLSIPLKSIIYLMEILWYLETHPTQTLPILVDNYLNYIQPIIHDNIKMNLI